MPMTIPFGTNLACFASHVNGPRIDILRSSAMPEPQILFLLGGGLVVLATLVRWLYPLEQDVAPKSMQVTMWISPAEVAEPFLPRETT